MDHAAGRVDRQLISDVTLRRVAFPTLLVAVPVLLALLLVIGNTGCSSGFVEGPPDDVESSSGDITAMGMETFVANCAECHGAAGQGHPDWQIQNADGTLNPPPLNGDGHTWHHADGLLYRIVRDGGAIPSQPDFKSGMPAFGDKLTRQEIVDVLVYIKTLWDGKTFSDVSILDLQARRSANDPFPA